MAHATVPRLAQARGVTRTVPHPDERVTRGAVTPGGSSSRKRAMSALRGLALAAAAASRASAAPPCRARAPSFSVSSERSTPPAGKTRGRAAQKLAADGPLGGPPAGAAARAWRA
jgi:hypothetical protein